MRPAVLAGRFLFLIGGAMEGLPMPSLGEPFVIKYPKMVIFVRRFLDFLQFSLIILVEPVIFINGYNKTMPDEIMTIKELSVYLNINEKTILNSQNKEDYRVPKLGGFGDLRNKRLIIGL